MNTRHLAIDDSRDSMSPFDGDYMLSRSEFDLGDLIEEVLKEHDNERQEKSVTFNAFCNLEGRIRLRMDEALIRVAISLIVDRAIASSPEGGTVEILVIKNPTYASVIVVDHGADIPFEKQRNMFDGSDIGLAVARRIAQLHGGAINVMSLPGKGARFIIKLPLSEEGGSVELVKWHS